MRGPAAQMCDDGVARRPARRWKFRAASAHEPLWCHHQDKVFSVVHPDVHMSPLLVKILPLGRNTFGHL